MIVKKDIIWESNMNVWSLLTLFSGNTAVSYTSFFFPTLIVSSEKLVFSEKQQLQPILQQHRTVFLQPQSWRIRIANDFSRDTISVDS